VVLSREVDVPHSHGRVSGKLRSGAAGGGAVWRFHVHELWHSKDVTDAWRTSCAVLCIEFMLFKFQDRRKEARKEKEKNREMAFH
jgi:hypothetical protein